MTKKKMSDIFQIKTITRKERNKLGEWEYLEKVYHEKRPVENLHAALRLLNYIVDLTLVWLIVILVDTGVGSNYPRAIDFLFPITYFAYYIIFEFYFQRTIGKYLTGSLVVDDYGERPELKAIFLRTITRIIPLDPYSFFWTEENRLWHDTWSNTFVISNDELSLIKRIQSGEKPKKSDKGKWDEWHNWQGLGSTGHEPRQW
jgi:uncharacterized RDD family membrane protein YckC